MRKNACISMDDWSAAIQGALKPIPGVSGGKTVSEIAAETGKGTEAVRQVLRKAMAKGTLESGAEYRLAIDGTYRTSPTYKLRGGAK